MQWRLMTGLCSFIVLQHDLYEITVDLAVGYTLNAALTHNPPLSVSDSVCHDLIPLKLHS